MLYHVITLTVPAGRQDEAVRLLKQLAERSNQINPRAVVEIVRRVDGPQEELLWVGKLASMEDHHAGGEVFQADPQVQAWMKEGEDFLNSSAERFYEIL